MNLYNHKDHGKIEIYADLYVNIKLYPKIENYEIRGRGSDLRFALSTIDDYSKYYKKELEESFFIVIWTENEEAYIIDNTNIEDFLTNNNDVLHFLLGNSSQTKLHPEKFVIDDLYQFLYLLYCHCEATIYDFRSSRIRMLQKFIDNGFPKVTKEVIINLCKHLKEKNRIEQQRIADTDCTTCMGFLNSRDVELKNKINNK